MSKRGIGLTVIFRPRSDIILIQYLPLYFRHSPPPPRCITGFEPFLYPSWLYTLAPIPIPNYHSEQINWCALLSITQQLRQSCLSHLSYERSLYNDGCSSHSIYYCSRIPKTLYYYSLSALPSCFIRRSSSLAS